MSSPEPSLDSFDSYEPWDPYDDPSQQQTQTNDLKLCQFPDWDSERTYDESYIRYSIEWKVTVKNRAIMPKDTEQDMVLAPAAYWQHFLQPKLGQIKEAPHPQLGRCLPKEMRRWMQNRRLLDTHLFGGTYITLCVVLALHVVWDLIAGVTLSLSDLPPSVFTS